jgi:hypothetical protein
VGGEIPKMSPITIVLEELARRDEYLRTKSRE